MQYKIVDTDLFVVPVGMIGIFKTWCKVWKGDKRRPDLDGYFNTGYIESI